MLFFLATARNIVQHCTCLLICMLLISLWAARWMNEGTILTRKTLNIGRINCSKATFYNINFSCIGRGSNPVLRSENLPTSRLNHGSAWLVSDCRQGKEIVVSQRRRDHLWDVPILLSSWYQAFFHWGSSGRDVNLIFQFYLVLRLRIGGAIPLGSYIFILPFCFISSLWVA
jgi:hypothetical protein